MAPHAPETNLMDNSRGSRSFQPLNSAPPPKSVAQGGGAQPVVPLPHMSEDTQELLRKASTQWLKCNEVVELLTRAKAERFPFSSEAAEKPPGGSLFLYDRLSVKFFRLDGHEWRKKGDGKSVRETHEKLKLEQVVVLNCYYAHAIEPENLQRRCYWLLDSSESFVLVHYLNVIPEGTRSEASYAQASPQAWEATTDSGDASLARSSSVREEERIVGGVQFANCGINHSDTRLLDDNSSGGILNTGDLAWEAIRYSSAHDFNVGEINLQWDDSDRQQQFVSNQMDPPRGGFLTGAEQYGAPYTERHPAEDLLELAEDLPDLPNDVPELTLGMNVGASMLDSRPQSIDGVACDIANSIDSLHMTSNPGTPVLQQRNSCVPQCTNHEQHRSHQQQQARRAPNERGVVGEIKAEPSSSPQGCDVSRGASRPGVANYACNAMYNGNWSDVDTDNLWDLVEPRTGMMTSRPPQSRQQQHQQASTSHGAAGRWPCQAQAMSPEVIHTCGGDRVLLVLDGLADYDPCVQPLTISIDSVLVTADRVKPGVLSFMTPELNQGCAHLQVLDTSVKPWRALCSPLSITVAQVGQALNRSLGKVRSESLESLKSLDGSATDYDYILRLTHALLLNMPTVEIEAMALQV